ncbi:hypothetical protein D5S17_08280 [Pseudonocardiaceae bacterium YIM PH 21723]|nr:hypothetical protein D5S17_08280 [Pseudonocardiaceae bacterium YIM PH 21723]
MTYPPSAESPQGQPFPGQQPPYGQPPFGQPPKKSKVWLWVLLSVLGVIILFFVGCAVVVGSIANKVNNDLNAEHSVVYEVIGAGSANIGFTEGDLDSASAAADAPLPFKKEVKVKGIAFAVNAIRSGGDGPLACKITVDGKVVKESAPQTGTMTSVECAYTSLEPTR